MRPPTLPAIASTAATRLAAPSFITPWMPCWV